MMLFTRGLVFCALAHLGSAQVQSGDFVPASKSREDSSRRALATVLPHLDGRHLAETSLTKDRDGGEEFGWDQFIHAGIDDIGEWRQLDAKEWVWTFSVTSTDAKALLPVFSQWKMPPDGRFFVYSDEDLAGAFTYHNNKANGQFAVRPVKGDTITLEYNGPRAGVELELEKVIHVYRGLFDDAEKGLGDSGDCNVNTACTEADFMREQVDSVVVLLNTESRGYCSGSMINNAAGQQLFLTAFHCKPGANDILLFNYQSPTCSTTSEASYTDTVQGLVTLASDSSSDFHLLRVEELIPNSYNAFFSGWDARPFSQGEQPYDDVYAIHHPSIDYKKISRSSAGATSSSYLNANGDTHWWVKTWELDGRPTATDYGTTEGGSSGSPLFSAERRIIGQLHGGYASCSNNVNDYYGALWQSFPDIEEYLAAGSGALTMDGEYLERTPEPTPAPFEDLHLGVLAVGGGGGDASGIVSFEGATAGREDTFGNPAPDVLISFALPASLATGSVLEIDTCSESTDYDTWLWLIDASGSVISSNDDTAVGCTDNGLTSHLRFEVGAEGADATVLVPGREYAVVVDGYSYSEGQFGLTISLQSDVGDGEDDDQDDDAPDDTDDDTTFVPTASPTLVVDEDNDDDTDDDAETVCSAMHILNRDFGCDSAGTIVRTDDVCRTILELNAEYGCGFSATGSPTLYHTPSPTGSPTSNPTPSPTASPTPSPTAAPETSQTATVQFKISNSGRFTTEAPLYLILLGEGGLESEPIDLGLVTARATHVVEATVTAPGIGPLRAVKLCLDESDPDRTRLVRRLFELVFDGTAYTFEQQSGQRTIRSGECGLEAVVVA